MTTNRLAKSEGGGPKQCPADMPRGDSVEAKAERMRFWIARGNQGLDEAGHHHMEWRAKDGDYWIAPRDA